MPRFGQLVVGPASVVNLDPAAEYFDYEPNADIRDLICHDDVMKDDCAELKLPDLKGNVLTKDEVQAARMPTRSVGFIECHRRIDA